MNGTAAIEYAREVTATLVRHEEMRHGDKMRAYETVARLVGRSASWVRKFSSGNPDVSLGLVPWLKIQAISVKEHYADVCECIEQDTQRRLARIEMLKDQANAVDPRIVTQHSRALARAESHGENK